jgi:membrane associated rhomboid family serine protease
MKAGLGTTILVVALMVMFGVELATHTAGNETALLKLGALPDNNELRGQYWRLVTYSFLHLNSAHLLLNALLLVWIGGLVENRMNLANAGAVYGLSVLASAATILFVHNLHPQMGATVGASGGIFGLLAAALVISYRHKADSLDQARRLRTRLWIAVLAGFGISFLPGISMAGHAGGFIAGAFLAYVAMARKNVHAI